MTAFEALLALAGLAALIGGAEALVAGSARLAAALRISPLVIGLTVVAFGTSTPELAVSVRSAATGRADLAVSNLIGSNIFNVLFILGVAASVAPLVVDRKLIRIDVPLMVLVSAATWALAADGLVSRGEGIAMVAGIVVYTAYQVREGRRESGPAIPCLEREAQAPQLLKAAGLAVAGLGLLLVGADWLVDGAVVLARTLGVGERVIGLTLVAAGTSMPELATSVVGALRGQRDLAVGNVVGSNVFNLLAVLGSAAAFGTSTGLLIGKSALRLDVPVMMVVAVACLPVFFSGFQIDRVEAALFLAAWVGYVWLLYRRAAELPWLIAAGFLLVVGAMAVAQWRRTARGVRPAA